jgi:regulator of nonsense transcripts 2
MPITLTPVLFLFRSIQNSGRVIGIYILHVKRKKKPCHGPHTDVPGMVMLCVHMHLRYPNFAEILIPSLLSAVSNNGGGGGGGADGEWGLPRRTCFRLLVEFVLHGIITDIRPIAKVIVDAAGAPSEEGKDYAVTDANLIVTLAKVGGNEILGAVPRSVKREMERLMMEVQGKGEGNLALVTEPEVAVAVAIPSEQMEPSKDAGGDRQKPDDEKSSTIEKEASLLETPFVVTLSNELRRKCQSTIDDFNSTVPHSRAVPPSATSTLLRHTLGAFRSLSNSLVATHRRLLKLEKRCDQDRLLQGNLSDAREKGLNDARSLMESLKKSVEALSEALDVDAPVLDEEEASNVESSDGKGIELWSRNNAGDENLGPFDDEETRSFYCNVPDLLSTKPPALLGINANDLEKLKERNSRVYGGNSGEEVEEEGDMPVIEEEVGENAGLEEAEEGDEKDGTMDLEGEVGGNDVKG